MSDRARSSVRTGSRSGPGGTDAAPDGATSADQAGSGTQTATGGSTAASAGTSTAGSTGASVAQGTQSGAGQAAPAQAAPAKAAAAKAAPAKAPAGGDGRPTAAETTAVHPGTPLVPGPAPAAGRGAVRPPVDATQAVQFPPAGGRPQTPPAGDAGRGRPAGRGGGRGPRRARLQLRHIDIWSAFKISLVVSFALFFVWMIAIGILYFVLGKFGVFDTINDLVGQLGTASGKKGSSDVVHVGVVLGGAAVIGLVNVVLLTALSTVATYIYNLFADLVGGLEVTLAERD